MKNVSTVMNILLKNYGKHRHPTIRRTSHEKDPFKVLMACLLSLRTQDKNTEIASNNLFAHATTPKEVIKIPIKKKI